MCLSVARERSYRAKDREESERKIASMEALLAEGVPWPPTRDNLCRGRLLASRHRLLLLPSSPPWQPTPLPCAVTGHGAVIDAGAGHGTQVRGNSTNCSPRFAAKEVLGRVAAAGGTPAPAPAPAGCRWTSFHTLQSSGSHPATPSLQLTTDLMLASPPGRISACSPVAYSHCSPPPVHGARQAHL